jgi:hypothetical protein
MNTTRGRADTSLLRRIRSEFHEMPGLCLTVRQAARLWNVDVMTSEQALRLLVTENSLHRSADGQYVATTRSERRASSLQDATSAH